MPTRPITGPLTRPPFDALGNPLSPLIPAGYALLTDADGALLTDSDGNLLMELT